MPFPSRVEYQTAIQNPAAAFPDIPELAEAHAYLSGQGIPRPYSGNFATTFRLQGARDWAVRCYEREVRDVAARYAAISRFIETRTDPAFVAAKLVPRGISVGDTRHDIIQMEWVRGDHFDEYVGKSVEGDPAQLTDLAAKVLGLGMQLERLGVAHGDLQGGNVLVEPSGDLRLVDYDDMFLPDLRDLHFCSLGHENYQHPGRESTDFDERLDRFSIISIYIALCALAVRPDFWEAHDGGDGKLLFCKADFLDPSASRLFQDLSALAETREHIDRFASVCKGRYADIPSIAEFFDGRFSYTRYLPTVRTSPASSLPQSFRGGLPPSSLGIPPSSAGIPPVIGQPQPTYSSLPQHPEKRRFVLPMLGVAAMVLFLITLFSILGRRDAGTPVQSSAPLTQSTQPPQAMSRPVRSEKRDVVPSVLASVPFHPSPAPVPSASLSEPAPPSPVNTVTTVEKRLPSLAAPPVVVQQSPVVSTPPSCTVADGPVHLITKAEPELSAQTLAAAAGKSVVVTVDVSANGSVRNTTIVTPSGEVQLDLAALSVAARSTYAPAESHCVASPGSVDMTVTY